ncbi:hypothetical protein HHK36_006558 [Tetracentron sinense]|uniref:RING-type E3 ubiquitin transferase n=1 Tax=Tetracentron sinense TaxID=13715 RepID=A0A834ZL40_TETSI|nr:hypothetical protein HHK36_006558 [Tetracentron sinense]
MSSAGISGAGGGNGDDDGGATALQLYFCHQCKCTVSITPSTTFDLACPNCKEGFLEESQNPNSRFPGIFSFNVILDLQNPNPRFPRIFSTTIILQESENPNPRFPQRSVRGPNVFSTTHFVHNYLQSLRARGAIIQLVVETHRADRGFRLPTNLGDYSIGPRFEDDPSRYGRPPASKSAVDALLNIKISDELLQSDSAQCAVCKDMFELGTDVKQMPCEHVYHSDCILPWLALHSSCPVCRYELPTDDPDSQNQDLGTPLPANSPGTPLPSNSPGTPVPALVNSGSGGAPQDNPHLVRIAERRFRILLLWPVRTLSSPAEMSNSGADTNNSNNDGESNSGGRGNLDL